MNTAERKINAIFHKTAGHTPLYPLLLKANQYILNKTEVNRVQLNQQLNYTLMVFTEDITEELAGLIAEILNT
jgi:hypothetical protein